MPKQCLGSHLLTSSFNLVACAVFQGVCQKASTVTSSDISLKTQNMTHLLYCMSDLNPSATQQDRYSPTQGFDGSYQLEKWSF